MSRGFNSDNLASKTNKQRSCAKFSLLRRVLEKESKKNFNSKIRTEQLSVNKQFKMLEFTVPTCTLEFRRDRTNKQLFENVEARLVIDEGLVKVTGGCGSYLDGFEVTFQALLRGEFKCSASFPDRVVSIHEKHKSMILITFHDQVEFDKAIPNLHTSFSTIQDL